MNILIASGDTMFDGSDERYLAVGASALRAVKDVVKDAVITSILDLPCGHGRVARYLRSEWPTASLFVSDLNSSGMEFCAREFDASPLASAENFDDVDFNRKFDLIWVGSLITHLPPNETKTFFRFVARHLTPLGIAVLTSHGEIVEDRLRNGVGWMYGLSAEDQMAIHDEAAETGYGYRKYPGWSVEYGISLSSETWIAETAASSGLSVVAYASSAWDNHQDVFGLRLA